MAQLTDIEHVSSHGL